MRSLVVQAVSQRDPKRAFSSVDNPEPPVRRAAVDVLLLDSRFEWQERVLGVQKRLGELGAVELLGGLAQQWSIPPSSPTLWLHGAVLSF